MLTKYQPNNQYLLNTYTQLFDLSPDDTIETLMKCLRLAHCCERCIHYTPVDLFAPFEERFNFCYAHQTEHFRLIDDCPDCNRNIDCFLTEEDDLFTQRYAYTYLDPNYPAKKETSQFDMPFSNFPL
jgi:hypothetical protein